MKRRFILLLKSFFQKDNFQNMKTIELNLCYYRERPKYL